MEAAVTVAAKAAAGMAVGAAVTAAAAREEVTEVQGAGLPAVLASVACGTPHMRSP